MVAPLGWRETNIFEYLLFSISYESIKSFVSPNTSSGEIVIISKITLVTLYVVEFCAVGTLS